MGEKPFGPTAVVSLAAASTMGSKILLLWQKTKGTTLLFRNKSFRVDESFCLSGQQTTRVLDRQQKGDRRGQHKAVRILKTTNPVSVLLPCAKKHS